MQKIQVFIRIQNQWDHSFLEGTYDGFLTQEKIVYLEEKRTVTILKDSNTITITRRDQENYIFLTFEKNHVTKGIYKIDNLRSFEIQIETSLLEIFENQMHICYQTSVEKNVLGIFDFHLRY